MSRLLSVFAFVKIEKKSYADAIKEIGNMENIVSISYCACKTWTVGKARELVKSRTLGKLVTEKESKNAAKNHY